MRIFFGGEYVITSFEPTYKELKPDLEERGGTGASEFRAYLQGIETFSYQLISFSDDRCFEPTYKELKPINKKAESLLKQCFEPTYKELKRG